MPGRASRICTASGCGALVTDGSSRCPRHPPPVWQRSAGREGNTTDRGYGHDWRKLRAMVLERDAWLCQPSLQRGL